jgi:dCTP deaminase
MILTGSKIIDEVVNGTICLEPFDKSLVNPNSYNYRLGKELVEITYDVNDVQNIPVQNKITISDEGFVLQPNKLYLGVTFETIGSSNYVPSLIGRSSLGRLGLFLQITADLGHIGTYHKWTLELTVVQPLKVYPEMRIGQVSFWVPEGLDLLKGHEYRKEVNSYAKFSEPTYSLISKLLK